MASMGNCIKPIEPDQTSEAMLTKDLTDVIIDLTQRLNFKTREAEMYRQQKKCLLARGQKQGQGDSIAEE